MRTPRIRRAALALALAAIAATACAEGAAPETGAGPATTTPSPSLSPPPTAAVTTPRPPRPTPTAAGPTGNTDLADGTHHYAYLTRFDRDRQTLTVDVAQFLTGAAAEKAAQEDGKEAFDYYVRNQNKRLRTLRVAKGLVIVVNTLTASESGSSSKDVTISQGRLASFMASGRAQTRLFWFRLDHGVVVELREQYLP